MYILYVGALWCSSFTCDWPVRVGMFNSAHHMLGSPNLAHSPTLGRTSNWGDGLHMPIKFTPVCVEIQQWGVRISIVTQKIWEGIHRHIIRNLSSKFLRSNDIQLRDNFTTAEKETSLCQKNHISGLCPIYDKYIKHIGPRETSTAFQHHYIARLQVVLCVSNIIEQTYKMNTSPYIVIQNPSLFPQECHCGT